MEVLKYKITMEYHPVIKIIHLKKKSVHVEPGNMLSQHSISLFFNSNWGFIRNSGFPTFDLNFSPPVISAGFY